METSKKVWANLKRKKECYRKNLDLDVLRLGDANSRFFHYIMKQRFRRNEVVILKTLRGMLPQVDDVKTKIKDHFLNKFKEPWGRMHELTRV